MIITRSPLRITLGGGGTDLPSYYRNHEGFVISAAIDRYVYITLHQTFVEDLIVKYSQMERVRSLEDLRHPIVREAFKLAEVEPRGLEIASMADIPAGTGLGSSGSFTTALLKALYTYKRQLIHAEDLARLACEIEIGRLGEPVGKQDQYISAYGGITCFRFKTDDTVEARPLPLSEQTRFNLEDSLSMFFTGYSRSASSILKDQDARTRECDEEMLANLRYVKELGLRSSEALIAGDLKSFGRIMHEQWDHKKRRSEGVSNSTIDEWYELAMREGAIGGKLVGAGGGGFLLFLSEDKPRLRRALMEAGLKEVRFRFDFEGTKVVV